MVLMLNFTKDSLSFQQVIFCLIQFQRRSDTDGPHPGASSAARGGICTRETAVCCRVHSPPILHPRCPLPGSQQPNTGGHVISVALSSWVCWIQQYKRKTRGFCTSSCFGPHIWNSLQQEHSYCSTLSSFKAKLKTFLFSEYFHPNISTQFLLQSVCLQCVFLYIYFIILYVNCFGRTMLYMCIEYRI